MVGVMVLDMTFAFVHFGQQVSAHDRYVLQNAFTKGFSVPQQKYYLSNAGYSLSPYMLMPYRGMRYHLKEHK
jgi:hypothetical protein